MKYKLAFLTLQHTFIVVMVQHSLSNIFMNFVYDLPILEKM